MSGDAAGVGSGAVLTERVRQQVLAAVAARLTEHGVPGATLALVADGEPLWTAAVGSADLPGRQPLAADARTFIYSITKPLLATLALQMTSDHATYGPATLDLDAPVQVHLPWLTEHVTTPLPLRQVLQHTAGLPDYGALPGYQAALRADSRQPWDVATFLAQTLSNGLAYPPGAGWAYSNIGYLLVRLLLEAASGQPLAQLVQTRLADPLGLRATQVATTLDDTLALTPGYSSALNADAGDETLNDVRGRYHPGWVGHGVVTSTAAETARLLHTLTDPAQGPLPAESIAQMATPHVLPFTHPFFRQPSYGLGLMLDPRAPWGVLLGHGGGGPGYSLGTLQASDVGGRRVTSTVFANSDRGDLGLPLAHQLLALVAAGCAN